MRTVLAGAAALVALAGCSGGSDTSVPSAATPAPTTDPAPPPTTSPDTTTGVTAAPAVSVPASTTAELVDGWEVERLSGPAGGEVVTAVADDRTTVLAAGSETGGGVGVWVDRGDGFEPADLPEPSGQRRGPVALVAVEGGFVMAVRTGEFGRGGSELWRSDDGSVWRVDSGLMPGGDVEITALLAVGSTLVAGGLQPPPEPPTEPVEVANAALWIGDVGGLREVTPALSIGTPGYGFVADLDVVDGRLLAVGVDAGRPTRWTSDDGGLTWDVKDLTTVFPERWWWPIELVQLDDRLVLAMQGDGELLVRWSDDLTGAWQASGDLGEGLTSAAGTAVADGSFWLMGDRYFDGLARCYVDPTGCGSPTPVVLRSDDGATWEELDLDGVDVVDPSGTLAIVDRPDGVTVVAAPWQGDSLTVLTWRGDGDPPARPVADPLDDGGPPFVAGDAELAVGDTVRYPLNTHCGIDYLGRFNGRHWYLDRERDRPDVSPGDPGVPMVHEAVLGLATLVDETTIEYTLPGGGLFAVYTASAEEPPGCE